MRGRVLLDGAPVAGATVMFMPTHDGHPAYAITDSNGRFRLMTFKEGDGALRGEYKVVVTHTDPLPPPPQAEPGDPESVKEHYKALKATRNKKTPLPRRYGDAEQTPLRCTVPPDGEVVLNLESSAK